MKKNKNKNYFGLGILVILILMVIVAMNRSEKERGRDIKLGVLSDEGLGVVSISRDRQMISQMKIVGESQVWIPEGLGWYRAEVIKKMLLQENKLELVKKIFIYGLGFYPDEIILTQNIDGWKSRYWWQMLKNNNLLNKNESLPGDVNESEMYLDQVMLRDFAETNIVNEDIKLGVVNVSQVNGLAGFITRVLERLGFSVVSITTEEIELVDKCQILYGKETTESYSLAVIREVFDCDLREDFSLNGNEIEIYLTDNFSRMINYPSYKK